MLINLIKPLITERTLAESGKGKYTFVVRKGATKTEIKKAVEKTFGVNVIKTQTTMNHGKRYRTGKKWMLRHKPDWKKAVVTTKKDQVIDLFEATKREE